VSRFTFSSKERDLPTGFCYFGYRFYAPEWRCWISRDPIGEYGGINLYQYANGNPHAHLDAFGLAGLPEAEQELQKAIQAYEAAQADFIIAWESYQKAVGDKSKALCSTAFNMAKQTLLMAESNLKAMQLQKQKAMAVAGGAAGTAAFVENDRRHLGVVCAQRQRVRLCCSSQLVGSRGTGGNRGVYLGYEVSTIPMKGGGTIADSMGNGIYAVAPNFWLWSCN